MVRGAAPPSARTRTARWSAGGSTTFAPSPYWAEVSDRFKRQVPHRHDEQAPGVPPRYSARAVGRYPQRARHEARDAARRARPMPSALPSRTGELRCRCRGFGANVDYARRVLGSSTNRRRVAARVRPCGRNMTEARKRGR